MTTSIKIDFDDDGKCSHVRITRNGEQTLLPGGTCELSLMDVLLDRIGKGEDDVDVVAESVESALSANEITLVEAERIKRREAHLDGLLDSRRADLAAIEAQLADCCGAKAIVDKRAVLAQLEASVEANLAALTTSMPEATAVAGEPVK